jgi:hypothetical protein
MKSKIQEIKTILDNSRLVSDCTASHEFIDQQLDHIVDKLKTNMIKSTCASSKFSIFLEENAEYSYYKKVVAQTVVLSMHEYHKILALLNQLTP